MKTKNLLPNEKQALDSFSQTLKKQLGSNLLDIRLFGSKRRGDSQPDSDTDIFVLVKQKDITTHNLIIESALNTDLEYNVNISPIIFSEEEFRQNTRCHTPFIRNLEKEGVTL